MKGLRALLILKIALTALFWCIPLLTFPSTWFAALGLPAPAPLIFARLLGGAYLALLVGYYQGLKEIEAGHSPVPVLRLGIASNGLAAPLLFYFGATGEWSSWSIGAQAFMWLSAAGALQITFGLLKFRLRLAKAGTP